MTTNLTNEYDLPFELRVGAGVNTGYAMVGNTGSEDNPDFTPIGDTVNTAFRLESATKEIGIDLAIGETTYDYLKNLPDWQRFFEEYRIQLKGSDKPILIYGMGFEDLGELVTIHAIDSPSSD